MHTLSRPSSLPLTLPPQWGFPHSGSTQGKIHLMPSILILQGPLLLASFLGPELDSSPQNYPAPTLTCSDLCYLVKAPRPPTGLVPGPSHLMLSEKASTPNLETQ